MRVQLTFFFLVFYFYCLTQESVEQENHGFPPTTNTCEIYSKHSDWLPDAFINNATCACLKIPDEPHANIIRQVLIERLDSIEIVLKSEATLMKEKYGKKEISKHKYNKFVKKKITPIIYKDHVIAYETAGCKANPAPYFGWKIISTRKFTNCNFIWFSIRYFGGSCSGKWGKW